MKKTLLLILSFIILQNISAQDYVPFPSEDAQWNGFHFGYVPNMWSSISNYHYIMDGDTVINSIDYKKIYFDELEDNQTPTYIGALREDENKNIFFFPYADFLPTPSGHEFPNHSEEHLLYSFNNLSIGMELPINEEATTITVNSIDSILMGDTYRKTYSIHNQQLLFGEEFWIEGIGSTKDFLSPFTTEFEWELWTLCYTDTETYYINSPNGQDSCHYYINVGLEEMAHDIKIYPNPVQDRLIIKNTELPKSISYKVINTQGQILDFGQLNLLKNEIDFQVYPKGIYVLDLNEEGDRMIKKIVK